MIAHSMGGMIVASACAAPKPSRQSLLLGHASGDVLIRRHGPLPLYDRAHAQTAIINSALALGLARIESGRLVAVED